MLLKQEHIDRINALTLPVRTPAFKLDQHRRLSMPKEAKAPTPEHKDPFIIEACDSQWLDQEAQLIALCREIDRGVEEFIRGNSTQKYIIPWRWEWVRPHDIPLLVKQWEQLLAKDASGVLCAPLRAFYEHVAAYQFSDQPATCSLDNPAIVDGFSKPCEYLPAALYALRTVFLKHDMRAFLTAGRESKVDFPPEREKIVAGVLNDTYILERLQEVAKELGVVGEIRPERVQEYKKAIVDEAKARRTQRWQHLSDQLLGGRLEQKDHFAILHELLTILKFDYPFLGDKEKREQFHRDFLDFVAKKFSTDDQLAELQKFYDVLVRLQQDPHFAHVWGPEEGKYIQSFLAPALCEHLQKQKIANIYGRWQLDRPATVEEKAFVATCPNALIQEVLNTLPGGPGNLKAFINQLKADARRKNIATLLAHVEQYRGPLKEHKTEGYSREEVGDVPERVYTLELKTFVKTQFNALLTLYLGDNSQDLSGLSDLLKQDLIVVLRDDPDRYAHFCALQMFLAIHGDFSEESQLAPISKVLRDVLWQDDLSAASKAAVKKIIERFLLKLGENEYFLNSRNAYSVTSLPHQDQLEVVALLLCKQDEPDHLRRWIVAECTESKVAPATVDRFVDEMAVLAQKFHDRRLYFNAIDAASVTLAAELARAKNDSTAPLLSRDKWTLERVGRELVSAKEWRKRGKNELSLAHDDINQFNMQESVKAVHGMLNEERGRIISFTGRKIVDWVLRVFMFAVRVIVGGLLLGWNANPIYKCCTGKWLVSLWQPPIQEKVRGEYAAKECIEKARKTMRGVLDGQPLDADALPADDVSGSVVLDSYRRL